MTSDITPAAEDFVPRAGTEAAAIPVRKVTDACRLRVIDKEQIASAVPGEHRRLVRTALKEVHKLDRSLREYPYLGTEPRVIVLARRYLQAVRHEFTESSLIEFLTTYQQTKELEMGEIWALKPALQYVLLEELPQANSAVLASSLKLIGETVWKDLFEGVSLADRVLRTDPAGAYASMDYDSRDLYRRAVTRLARDSPRTETQVAESAVVLAEQAARLGSTTRAQLRRAHVGYYLLDSGIPKLETAIGYKPPFDDRVRKMITTHRTDFYIIGVELIALCIVGFLLSQLETLTPISVVALLLILPATQAGVDVMNSIITSLIRPRALPKLDFSEGIPEEHATLVAVPSLLLNESQVRNLVLDLEIRFLANRDRNLYFALVTDSPDSDEPATAEPLVDLGRELVEGLNHRYGAGGHRPFLLLHRRRVYNPSENRWMGWERKRGKLLDLNQLLRGSFDGFPVKAGDTSVLQHIQYVITLDSDTQLPRGAAAKLAGTIAHPLNRAVIDPRTNMVVEGYGILQPRIGISIDSASRSHLAALYSGQTGFDIYTRAVSDVYQDLFGEGIFTGKGIYEVDTFGQVLEHRFPENALLSHDLIEGAYARVALASDIELIDDYPSHFSAYSRRKHRWVRGDWQIMRWLLNRVPDFHGNLITNPISVISRWKIIDNLRRSLIEPATALFLLAGWFYLPGDPWFWTASLLLMLFIPVYSNLFFSVLQAPIGAPGFGGWVREVVSNFIKGNLVAWLSLVFLLHQAMLSLDAIGRSVLRVFITRKRLLEWETAAEAESAARRKATVDSYLDWSPFVTAAIAIALWNWRPEAINIAGPILLLWFAARGISEWLNRSPSADERCLSTADEQYIRRHAETIWSFYRDWSSAETNWLIPDNVREDGIVARRLSPTNAGLLLNARVAALHLDLITVSEFIEQTRSTLDTVERLEKHRGHLYNWYDLDTLEPLAPRFVSTVDSGNLAACLWTLRQAGLAHARRPELLSGTQKDLHDIAERAQLLVRDMDFRFLYQSRRKVLSVGYDASAGHMESSSYDLLASESRMASFIAVAKGDIPQEAWFHLGRAHALTQGQQVLLSWTGTMFEYLMPALWMRQYAGTLTERGINPVVEVQKRYARRHGVPWGISESACSAEGGGDYGYAPFGISALAMRHSEAERIVISPYSTFLALPVDPAAAVTNLRRMEALGWIGRYGFYESVDYGAGEPEVIRCWMAHHHGMSLLAACNILKGEPFRTYFHAEPEVMATELLLHERVPRTVVAEPERSPAAVSQAVPATAA